MSEIIKIQNDIFRNIYSQFPKHQYNEDIINKFEKINNIIKEDVFIPGRKTVIPCTKPSRRVSAFNCKFSKEEKLKKELFSLLNKLTYTNSEKILSKINIVHPYEDLFNIVYDFIKMNVKYFDLYLKVLDLFDKNWMLEKINTILANNVDYWLIPTKFKDEDIYSNFCDYDIYCEYNKWKDSVLITTRLFIHYNKKMDVIAKNIYKNIIKYLSTNDRYMRHLIDPYIEQLTLLKDHIDNLLLENIQSYSLPSSSKFKILNIIELKNSS